jgi:preprotein translocase subunit SecE
MFQKITKFLIEVRQEMSKVSWPTREELRGSTIVVITVSLIFAIFIYLVDQVLSNILSIIY